MWARPPVRPKPRCTPLALESHETEHPGPDPLEDHTVPELVGKPHPNQTPSHDMHTGVGHQLPDRERAGRCGADIDRPRSPLGPRRPGRAPEGCHKGGALRVDAPVPSTHTGCTSGPATTRSDVEPTRASLNLVLTTPSSFVQYPRSLAKRTARRATQILLVHDKPRE